MTNIHNHTLVIDIETVPDLSVLGEDYDKAKFPAPIGHKIVTIAMCDISKYVDGYVVNKICSSRGPEEEVLTRVAEYIENKQPQIVSWNGKGFDIPVLVQRCFKLGIPLPGIFKSRERNKWENYTQRYADAWHCDVMDAMANYGASRNIKLDLAASSIGLPGKIGIDGSNVASLYENGQIDKIADYCETDVMNTYCVCLRWFLTIGKITPAIYRKSVDNFFDYIMEKSEERSHFRDFIHQTDFNEFKLTEPDEVLSIEHHNQSHNSPDIKMVS